MLGQSVAAAAQRHHVVVLLQHHVLLVVEVQQADGLQPVGDAAGGAHLAARQPQRVDDGAHRGVVGRSQVAAQRERAGASAVVGVVAARGDDPPGPADLLEVHEERNPLAGLGPAVRRETRRGRTPPLAPAVGELGGGRRGLGLSCGKEGGGDLLTLEVEKHSVCHRWYYKMSTYNNNFMSLC